MKIEKKLQNMVDDALWEKYGNEELLNELKQKQAENNKVKGNTKRKFPTKKFIYALSCMSVIMIAVTLSCVYLIKPAETVPGYLQENEIQMPSSINDLNEALKFLSPNEHSLWQITSVVDSVSGDVLNYIAILNDDGFDALELRFVTNERYLYPWQTVVRQEEPFKKFVIKYDEKSDYDEELEMYTFNCEGVIETPAEKIYVSYEGFSETEDSPFLEFLGSHLQMK